MNLPVKKNSTRSIQLHNKIIMPKKVLGKQDWKVDYGDGGARNLIYLSLVVTVILFIVGVAALIMKSYTVTGLCAGIVMFIPHFLQPDVLFNCRDKRDGFFFKKTESRHFLCSVFFPFMQRFQRYEITLGRGHLYDYTQEQMNLFMSDEYINGE